MKERRAKEDMTGIMTLDGRAKIRKICEPRREEQKDTSQENEIRQMGFFQQQSVGFWR